jgi:hypothetical protein
MVSVEALKKEVNELTRRVNPPEKHFTIDMNFSTLSEPHGFLNGSIFHIVSKHGKEQKWHEAVSTEEELRSNRAYYDGLMSRKTNSFMKDPSHPFHSFESFIEVHRCKCGQHGASNMEPYLGEKP